MLTVVETALFQQLWPHYWEEEERAEFASFLAVNPEAGDGIPKSGGLRKIRWKHAGTGKSGGVRIIYFARTATGELVLLTMYAKSEIENLNASVLKEISRAIAK
jgi:hypothetical protein